MTVPPPADPGLAGAAAPADLARVLRAAWPLLASVLLLMVGSGLQGSLLGVRADQARFDATVVGLVLGVYYLGYVAGSAWVPGLIRTVGHIRVFAALASVASAAVVIHGVWISPVPWMILRFTTGVCVAGLFVVSESWLNDVSTPRTRATLLAVYNTVVTAGLAVGTLLLNVADTAGFVLFVVGSTLLSVAAVPVALAPHDAPVPNESTSISLRRVIQAAPLGLAGGAMSGFGTGSALGFGAVYATRAGFGVSGASQFVIVVLLGAVLGQIPLGNLSDRTDRRVVMGVAALLIVVGGVIGIVSTEMASFPGALAAGALIGAGSFSLYGLSFAHMADYISPANMISAGSRLITVNGLGSAAGPISAAVALSVLGPEGLFVGLVGIATVFGTFVVVRMRRREAPADDRRAHYTAVAASSTIAALDDVVAETVADVVIDPTASRDSDQVLS